MKKGDNVHSIAILMLVAILFVGCGGGGGEVGGSSSGVGWIDLNSISSPGGDDITYVSKNYYITPSDSVRLAGDAWTSKAYSNRNTGNPGVSVTWENYATGETGSASQRADWGCDWFVCGWIHDWGATIPLGLGENFIEVTAYDPAGKGGKMSITFTHPLTHMPKIESTSVDQVQSDVFVFRTVIEPGGLSVGVWFDYGTDPDLASFNSTSLQTLSAIHDRQTFNYNLSNSTANTTYYFQTQAENSEGTTAGPILEFSTYPADSPLVYTKYATLQRRGEIIFTGSVNPRGSTAQVWFEWGTDPSTLSNASPSQEIGSSLTKKIVQQTVTGMLPDTTYYFRTAADNAVMTRYGEVLSITTNLAPAVTTRDAEVLENRTAVIRGTINPNGFFTHGWFEFGADPDLTEFRKTKDQFLGYGTDTLNITQTVEDLSWGATYYYRAVADDINRGEIYSFTLPQVTASTWSTTFGGNGTEHINEIILTADGGYLVCGETDSFGAGKMDAWLVKLDENGRVEWEKTYGTWDDDSINSVLPMSDGGYVAIGKHSSYKFWILKLSAYGSIEWQNTYGSDNGGPKSVIQTSDGGLLVIAQIGEYDWYLETWYMLKAIKIRMDGTVEWQKAYGAGTYFYGYDVLETLDSDFVISGKTYLNGIPYMSLLKVDRYGEILWSQRYAEDTKYFYGYGDYSLTSTPDGGYVLTGIEPVKVVKFSSGGLVEWANSYGEGVAESVINTSDGGYLLNTNSRNRFGVTFIKLHGDGTVQWQKLYKAEWVTFQAGSSVKETSDGGFVVAGNGHISTSLHPTFEYTDNDDDDAWVMKTDGQGMCAPLDTDLSHIVTPIEVNPTSFPLSMIESDYLVRPANGVVVESKALVFQQAP